MEMMNNSATTGLAKNLFVEDVAQEIFDTCASNFQQTAVFKNQIKTAQVSEGEGQLTREEVSICGRTSLGLTWTVNMARLPFLLPLLLTTARYLGWNAPTQIREGEGKDWTSLTLYHLRAFYVPGVAPTDYKEGDDVDVKAVKMTSAHTQVSAADFCTAPAFEKYTSNEREQTAEIGLIMTCHGCLMWHLWKYKYSIHLTAQYIGPSCRDNANITPFCFLSCPMNTTPCLSVSPQMEWGSIAVKILDKSSGKRLTSRLRTRLTHLSPSFNHCILRGERIVNTPYKIGMNKNVECAVLCKDKK